MYAAHTIPKGFTFDAQQKQEASALLPRLDDVVAQESRRYNRLPGIEQEVLLQEARALAAYAVATWRKERGRQLRNWVGLVIRRGLYQVAKHELALKRRPREAASRSRQPMRERRLEMFCDLEAAELMVSAAEAMTAHEYLESAGVVQAVLDGLTAQERAILMLKMSPPPELRVAHENVGSQRQVPSNRLVAQYLGVSRNAVRLALSHARKVWRSVDAD